MRRGGAGRWLWLAACGPLACGGAEPVADVGVPPGTRLLRVPSEHATIQAAVDAAATGDVILLAPGVYKEQVAIKQKGVTLASHFVASARPSDVERTVLQGGAPGPIVTIQNSETARVVGLSIRGGAGAGIDVRRSRVEILDSRLTSNRDDGIAFKDSQALVRGNALLDNGDDGIDSDGANALVIEGNEISYNQQDGVELRLHDYTGPMLEITLRGNRFKGNKSDGIQIIDYPGASDRRIRIERNVFVGNLVGIGSMADGATDENFRGAPLAEPVHVIHNTFVSNHYGVTGGDDTALVNNVFARTFRTAVRRLRERSAAANNLFWRNGGDWSDSTVADSNAVRADPRLDSEQRLGDGSAAIDAGATSFAHRGVELIPAGSWSGAAPDLGAFERE